MLLTDSFTKYNEMKKKVFFTVIILLSATVSACTFSTKKSDNETSNADSLSQTIKSEEEVVITQVNYNDYPIAYVKEGGLHFFNPEDQTSVQFTEETDTVFNCVYSDNDAMFYYTVSRNGMLSLKEIDLSVAPVQPKPLVNWNKPATEFFTKTYGEKAKLIFLKNNLLLEYNYLWDYFCFTEFLEYSIDRNVLTTINRDQFEQKYGYYPTSVVTPEKDFTFIYDKAKQLALSTSDYADEGFEIEYFFKGASADGSKIVFSIMLSMGDLAHGPYCVANTDGTMITLLQETDMAYYSLIPLWSNNNAVFMQNKSVGEYETITELYYTLAAENTPALIDQNVDYFAVRKKHPIN